MTVKEHLQRFAVGTAFDALYLYMKKNPQQRLTRLVDFGAKRARRVFPEKTVDKISEGARDPNNVWTQYGLRIFSEVDQRMLKRMVLAFGLGALNGTRLIRENREHYNCNLPFILLFDPTSACNRNCKGCWSGDYDHCLNLSYEEMDDIVAQSSAFGTRVYMLTGGEPLIRKKDILRICEKYPNCAFLVYTNATLIDQALCDEIKRVGNLTIAVSIEGNEESNDARRGEGSYKTALAAMDLMRKNRILFGMSVCYTRDNIDYVTSDAFMDLMVQKGVLFSLYFNYMPIGKGAVESLLPTPAQREHMYNWLRQIRNGKTGKPLFLLDFQNDAEYVGGCIAGGRNYFHINSAGDIEPCVFIHYSDSNIRTHTLIEALRNPLFQSFYHNQPFNDNHLRPCPMLENPDHLRKMIRETGAKSTDLEGVEDVEVLCRRCDKFANAWAPVAQELWDNTKHPNPKTQYYRDTPQGKAAAQKQEPQPLSKNA